MSTEENSTQWFSPLSIFASLTFVNFVIMYCVTQYFGKQTVSEVFSFAAADPPGPLEKFLYTSQPIMGNHYFGDLFQTLMTSRLGTPYFSPNHKLTSQYPPLSHWIFWPVTGLSPSLVIFGFLLLTAVLIFLSLKLLTNESFGDQRIFLIFLMCITGPVISVLDRGSLTGVIFALVIFSIFGATTVNNKIFFGVLANSLKLFPIVYALEISRTLQKKISIKSLRNQALGTIVLTGLPFLFLTGKLSENFMGFWKGVLGQANTESNIQISGRSVSAFFSSLSTVFGANIGGTVITVSTLITGVIIAGLCIFQYCGPLASKSRIEERILLLTIIVCLIPKSVGTYQLIFLLAPLVLMMQRDFAKQRVSINSVLLMIVVLPIRYQLQDGLYLDSLVTVPILLVCAFNVIFEQVKRVG